MSTHSYAEQRDYACIIDGSYFTVTSGFKPSLEEAVSLAYMDANAEYERLRADGIIP